jgi:F-box/WD-40 domain protein MET30
MSLSQSFDWNPNDCQASNNSAPNIDAGKMLFSASDDATIKLWDLSLRTCIRQFTGHVGQVQALKLVYFDQPVADHAMESADDNSAVLETFIPPASASSDRSDLSTLCRDNPEPTQQQLVLVSGSLDNTVKQWDISSGKAVKTFFGHIEGVWAVASDKMRLISGSHDRTIKVRGMCNFHQRICDFPHFSGLELRR